MKAQINHNEIDGARVDLVLKKSAQGYTWYSLYDGQEQDTEISGSTVEQAVENAGRAWGATCWGLEWIEDESEQEPETMDKKIYETIEKIEGVKKVFDKEHFGQWSRLEWNGLPIANRYGNTYSWEEPDSQEKLDNLLKFQATMNYTPEQEPHFDAETEASYEHYLHDRDEEKDSEDPPYSGYTEIPVNPDEVNARR